MSQSIKHPFNQSQIRKGTVAGLPLNCFEGMMKSTVAGWLDPINQSQTWNGTVAGLSLNRFADRMESTVAGWLLARWMDHLHVQPWVCEGSVGATTDPSRNNSRLAEKAVTYPFCISKWHPKIVILLRLNEPFCKEEHVIRK